MANGDGGPLGIVRTVTTWSILAAAIGIAVGWGISVGSWSERIKRNSETCAKVQVLEVNLAKVQSDVARIPSIEAKLDRLLDSRQKGAP